MPLSAHLKAIGAATPAYRVPAHWRIELGITAARITTPASASIRAQIQDWIQYIGYWILYIGYSKQKKFDLSRPAVVCFIRLLIDARDAGSDPLRTRVNGDKALLGDSCRRASLQTKFPDLGNVPTSGRARRFQW